MLMRILSIYGFIEAIKQPLIDGLTHYYFSHFQNSINLKFKAFLLQSDLRAPPIGHYNPNFDLVEGTSNMSLCHV